MFSSVSSFLPMLCSQKAVRSFSAPLLTAAGCLVGAETWQPRLERPLHLSSLTEKLVAPSGLMRSIRSASKNNQSPYTLLFRTGAMISKNKTCKTPSMYAGFPAFHESFAVQPWCSVYPKSVLPIFSIFITLPISTLGPIFLPVSPVAVSPVIFPVVPPVVPAIVSPVVSSVVSSVAAVPATVTTAVVSPVVSPVAALPRPFSGALATRPTSITTAPECLLFSEKIKLSSSNNCNNKKNNKHSTSTDCLIADVSAFSSASISFGLLICSSWPNLDEQLLPFGRFEAQLQQFLFGYHQQLLST